MNENDGNVSLTIESSVSVGSDIIVQVFSKDGTALGKSPVLVE